MVQQIQQFKLLSSLFQVKIQLHIEYSELFINSSSVLMMNIRCL